MEKYESRVQPVNQPEPQRNVVDFFLINVINIPICFHSYRMENDNDDISLQGYLKNSQICRGSYLYLKLFFIVHIFEFYLVTQSL